jgi:3(or 17)beta-hydroxysteroid dehydrogenase
MKRVEGKVVLITGGASGVGRDAALLLAGEGARVVIADLDESAGEALARELGEAALFVRHDVASESSWASVMSLAQARFGALHALVNSAAIFRAESIERTSLELWYKVMAVNAAGCFLGCKYAIEAMKEQGGVIVNMSSTAALAGFAGMAAYTTSKGAVTALTRNVAVHCRNQGYRIRCNSVHPAGINTPMTAAIWATLEAGAVSFETNPRSTVCEPREVSNLILFLVSDESRFITGTELRVDNALLIALG